MNLQFSKSPNDKSDNIVFNSDNKVRDTIDYPIPHEGEIVILKSGTWVVENVAYNYDLDMVVVFIIAAQFPLKKKI